MVDDDTLLLRGAVAERGWPSLIGFEGKGETVLSRRKTRTVVNHHFGLREHVASLEVFHLKVTVLGGADILWPVVIVTV